MVSATITVDAEHRVSALFLAPPAARACYVFAHGAGAGMNHALMEAISAELASVGIATLRYQFPYMEGGSRRPDPPALCHATVRAAVAEAAKLAEELPLLAGGRSFGGRMTSQAQAKSPLPGVVGLVFMAFPLHSAGKPADARAEHLAEVKIPLLFVQGDRDELADLALLKKLIARLESRATLKLLKDADHSFHVPARSGRKDADVLKEVGESVSQFTTSVSVAD
jgi:uncharacterized protein